MKLLHTLREVDCEVSIRVSFGLTDPAAAVFDGLTTSSPRSGSLAGYNARNHHVDRRNVQRTQELSTLQAPLFSGLDTCERGNAVPRIYAALAFIVTT